MPFQSLGREDSPEGGHSNSLQYFCLENPIPDRSLVGYSQKESACTGAWLPGSFMDQRKERRWGKESKKLFNPCKCPLEWQASGRGVFSFISLQSFTGGWLRLSPWGRPYWRHASNNKKSAGWGLKSEKQIQHKFKINPSGYEIKPITLGCCECTWENE